jgi:hypothetical protein
MTMRARAVLVLRRCRNREREDAAACRRQESLDERLPQSNAPHGDSIIRGFLPLRRASRAHTPCDGANR